MWPFRLSNFPASSIFAFSSRDFATTVMLTKRTFQHNFLFLSLSLRILLLPLAHPYALLSSSSSSFLGSSSLASFSSSSSSFFHSSSSLQILLLLSLPFLCSCFSYARPCSSSFELLAFFLPSITRAVLESVWIYGQDALRDYRVAVVMDDGHQRSMKSLDSTIYHSGNQKAASSSFSWK